MERGGGVGAISPCRCFRQLLAEAMVWEGACQGLGDTERRGSEKGSGILQTWVWTHLCPS